MISLYHSKSSFLYNKEIKGQQLIKVGRLVKTHSTYIEGLIKKLKKIKKHEKIKTITPGVIGATNGKVEKLTIKVTRETENGFKLVARKGKEYQEVYLIGSIEKNILQKLLNAD